MTTTATPLAPILKVPSERDPYQVWDDAFLQHTMSLAEARTDAHPQPSSSRAPSAVLQVEGHTPHEGEIRPCARFAHAACTADDNVIVFGGAAFEGAARSLLHMNDTWQLCVSDGWVWTHLATPTPPTPRCAHSMVWRCGANTIYVFGGRGARDAANDLYVLELDDLAAYNLARKSSRHTTVAPPSWTKIPAIGAPPRRSGHSAVMFDNASMVIHGGRGVQDELRDTWVYHCASQVWVEVRTEATPAPRVHHTAICITHLMYIYGGSVKTVTTTEGKTDVCLTDCTAMYSINLREVVGKSHELQIKREELLATYGAKEGPLQYRDYVIDGSAPAWNSLRNIRGAVPKARHGHSCVALGTGFLIFGGESECGADTTQRVFSRRLADSYSRKVVPKALRDAAYFDSRKYQWVSVEVTPSPQDGHPPDLFSRGGLAFHSCAAIDDAGELAVLFGNSAGKAVPDVLLFDCEVEGHSFVSQPANIGDRAGNTLTAGNHLQPRKSSARSSRRGSALVPRGRSLGSSQIFSPPGEVRKRVYKGANLGLEVGRSHVVGDFCFGTLKRELLLHYLEHERKELGMRHGVEAAGCIKFNKISCSNKFSALMRLNKMHTLIARVRKNLERTRQPCPACGSILDALFLPCAHAVLCLSCSLTVLNDSEIPSICPACNETVTDTHRLFAKEFSNLRNRCIIETPETDMTKFAPLIAVPTEEPEKPSSDGALVALGTMDVTVHKKSIFAGSMGAGGGENVLGTSWLGKRPRTASANKANGVAAAVSIKKQKQLVFSNSFTSGGGVAEEGGGGGCDGGIVDATVGIIGHGSIHPEKSPTKATRQPRPAVRTSLRCKKGDR